MKEELMKQIAGLVEFTKEGIVKGVEVIQREAPEIVTEILRWELTVNIVSFVVGVLLMIIAFKFYKKGKLIKDNTVCQETDSLVCYCLTGIIGLFSQTFLWLGLFDMLKILIAPRLYLISYFTKLVR